MHLRSLLNALALCSLATLAACSNAGGGGYYFPDDASKDGDDATPEDTEPTADTPVTCDPPRALCSGACVDTLGDVRNCGGCGRLCPSGQTCDNGACSGGTPTCAAPRALCGTACVDTLNDNANCGACGRACPTGQTCNDGACRAPTPTCAAPRTMCGTSCVDTQTDRANCGGCGRACASTQNCAAGVCAAMPPTCAAPRMMCGASCIDVTTDVNNCGFCGVRCTTGQTCSTGLCFGGPTCAAPRTMCGSLCVDTTTDVTNCGACGVRCATGQTCTAGRCQTTSTGSSRAGGACTMGSATGESDPACGALLCYAETALPYCTDGCTNSTSQAVEQSMCGGAGSTCLQQGDAPDDASICTASCRPSGTTTATGACRSGFICTGWWFTHATGDPDATGCASFCSSNANCQSGYRCNPRTGDCDAMGLVTTRLPDGSACNPTTTVTLPGETTPRNIQCRGICFTVGTATQGICGSFVDMHTTTTCPDNPAVIAPLAPPGTDNLGICIFRDCARGSDCASPLICRYPEDATGTPDTTGPLTCDYPTARQPRSVL